MEGGEVRLTGRAGAVFGVGGLRYREIESTPESELEARRRQKLRPSVTLRH